MQYYCKNQERRSRVSKGNTVNGIDYIEVADSSQKFLFVHFIHPLPGENGGIPAGSGLALDKDNIRIEGGVRITNIEVKNVISAGPILEVEVRASGDFSMYTLRLVASPNDPSAPQGFDPQLAAIDFSFKADCPSAFDCKTETPCSDAPVTDPRIDYLAKDYGSFRRIMLDRLSLLMPEWEERNAADLQMALVELLAYTGDHLSYYQDAVATEAYLFRARKRVSARRHVRLLDYHVHNGCNARTWIALEVAQNSNADQANLASGTTFLTKGPGGEVMVSPEELAAKLQEKGVEVFETLHSIDLYFQHNEIQFYTWDQTDCCLPTGATHATLFRTDQEPLFLLPGQVLIFEEIKSPTTGKTADANPSHRHAVRLIKSTETVDVLDGTKVVEIEWHEEDALPFPLCINTRLNGILQENLSVARGNIVLADHGRTVTTKALRPPKGSDTGSYRPALPDTGLSVVEPYIHHQRTQQPASRTLKQAPHRAIPAIQLTWNNEIWQARRDLLASDRFAAEFVAEIESDRTTQLRFGDGILGKKPEPGFKPIATYRIGNGLTGNVGAEAIGRIVWDKGGIQKVRNPLPGQGGQNPETIEHVRQFAPEAFRKQARAVTAADYVAKTELHPQVQKAFARFQWTGSWYTVYLTIDRRRGLEIDSSFKQEIITHLEQYRMAGYDLDIRPPVFVPLEVALNVCVKPGYFRSAVKGKLLTAFSRFDFPDGSRGFFHPDSFTFGQPVYVSAIYERALKVEGVASAELKLFKRSGRPTNEEIKNGRLQPTQSEIIRLDNDPNFPENGKISFYMFGGL